MQVFLIEEEKSASFFKKYFKTLNKNALFGRSKKDYSKKETIS